MFQFLPKNMATLWVVMVVLLSGARASILAVRPQDQMKCSYGERGSLTATCVNARIDLFKSTPYKFDHLDETLLCVNCNLTSIEPNSFDISGNQIRNLDISDSQIENLKSKAFMGLIFLEKLNMSYNKIRSVYPRTFQGTKKITTLDISNNALSILAEDGFAELINLKKLSLNNNRIKSIDEKAFNGLVSIQELDLNNNSITEISKQISNLTSLEILGLGDNQLSSIDGKEFYNLTKLMLLDLRNNLLTKPAFLMDPANVLRKIDLSGNRIDVFWFPLGRLHELETLLLGNNNITRIVYAGDNLVQNLRVLDLSSNAIQIIETGLLTGLSQLNELNLSRNAIEEIKVTGVLGLPSLHTLDLSYNLLSDLDYNLLISRTPSLSYLKLQNNLLPCELERRMEFDFQEDNFKYVLYENVVGSMKCVEKPLAEIKSRADAYVDEKVQTMTSGNIVMLVLMILVIIAVAFLFYAQYKFYKGESFTLHTRTDSNLQLVNQQGDIKDEE